MSNKIKGVLSDNLSLKDICSKHKEQMPYCKSQLIKGIEVETEHTKDLSVAKEIAMDHLYEDINYYKKLKKIEAKECTMSDSSGAYSTAFNSKPIKKKISSFKLKEEIGFDTYDTPFGMKKKNPLKIDGVKSIGMTNAVKNKKFPKWGGPGGIFIKIKDKCKKFPYCNQGDINSIEILKEAINEVSKEKKLPVSEIEKLIIKEINQIFI